MTTNETTADVESAVALGGPWHRTGCYFLTYTILLSLVMVVEGSAARNITTIQQLETYQSVGALVGIVATVVGIILARTFKTGFWRGFLAFMGARFIATAIGMAVSGAF